MRNELEDMRLFPVYDKVTKQMTHVNIEFLGVTGLALNLTIGAAYELKRRLEDTINPDDSCCYDCRPDRHVHG